MKKLILVLAYLLLAIPCGARTITVDDDGPADFSNIQAAIDDSNDGDTIIVAPGTYTGPGNRDIDFLGKAITVRSTEPNDPDIVSGTVIDCNHTSPYVFTPFNDRIPGRGFNFHSGEDTNSVLAGLTIKNGLAPAATVYDGWYEYKHVSGGAILCDASSPTIAHCRIIGNQAPYYHYVTGPFFCLGGGICGLNDSKPVIKFCTIMGNSVDGIYADGGGLHACHGSISNCTVIGNSVAATTRGSGGGISKCDGPITNCTIVGNYGDNTGGGLCLGHLYDSTISNCIVRGNEAENGPQIALVSSPIPPAATFSYGNIEGGEASVYVEGGCTLNWGEGNIDLETLLTNDGHLRAGSVCINGGDPNYSISTGETDIDSEERVYGGRIDIGSDEFIDTDGDGLPDWWEQQYFGSVTAGETDEDNDGDGTDNLTEYYQSSNPARSPYYYVNPVAGNNTWDGRSPEWDGVHGPKATIQAAINAAVSVENDVIILAEGTYTGPGNRDIDFLGKAITVRSTDPNDPNIVATTIIDCQGTYSEPHRGFNFHRGEGPESVLAGVTIINGYAPKDESLWIERSGGAILCEDSSPTITKCSISGNKAYEAGGGIYCKSSSPTITNCTITGNTASYGGGIFCYYGSPEITNCDINGNSGGGGGGISCTESNSNIANCTISNNSGRGIAGGVGPISNCTITGNAGGGISYCEGPITNCIITNNSAEEDGGGLYRCDGPITNCIICGNKAKDGTGGGLDICPGSITNCIISNNTAAYSCGGVSRCNGPITSCIIVDNMVESESGYGLGNCGQITNCIIWGNRPEQIYRSNSVTYSNVQGGWPGQGNIGQDPCFALDTDYHIMPTSPCIDAGTNDPCGGLAATDIEGIARPLDGDGDGNAVADMGAYEYVLNSPSIAVSARSLYFTQDWPKPDPQTLLIRNCGGQPLHWEITEDCNWLQVSPANGVSTDQINEVTITVDPNGFAPGLYSYDFDVQDPNASNNPVTVCVTMPVGEILPVPSQDFNTIQDAIDAADNYDIVLVADGNYIGQGNTNLDFRGKPITVCSENGPNNCIIDCQNSGYGFHFQNEETENAVVNGFTITNADVGIHCYIGSPTIKNCTIRDNRDFGILCMGPSYPEIANCTISDNGDCGIAYCLRCYEGMLSTTITNCTVSSNSGSGISTGCCRGTLTITNSTITHNSSDGYEYNSGGGITSSSCRLTIKNSIITDNSTEGYGGGGIYCDHSDLTITNSTISDNSARRGGGGGIFCWGKSLEIIACNISGNSASCGGGIDCMESANANIINCTITGNRAEGKYRSGGHGGGLAGCDGPITNCTITGNSTNGSGGGLAGCDGPITNCIIWNNAAIDGPQLYFSAEPTYSCIQDWTGGGQGNIDAEPYFAFSTDYHLMPDSPCIDAGDPNYIPEPGETDLDGNPRIIDGNGDANAVIDMGAYEFDPNFPSIAVSAPSFYFIQDWPETAPQILLIRNCGGSTLYWEIIEDCNWLEVAPPNGASTGQVNDVILTVDPDVLEPGLFNSTLIVQDPNASNSPVTVQVELRVRTILRVPSHDYPTIQDAIDAADDYDMVLVADRTYTGEGNKNLDFYGKPLTVRSENGPSNCIIDCQNSGYGFHFQNEESENSVVDGFTITGAYAGIYCYICSPTIKNCTIADNSADEYGGGVYCEKSSPAISYCTIMGNSAGDDGGGIYCLNQSNPTINNCTITGNSADRGGGIYCEESSPTLTNCTFSRNSADDGGGMFNYSGSPTITNCTFSGNSAYRAGGGFFRCDGPITNCIITGNSAESGGGGFFRCDGPITNCTITGNLTNGSGGGLAVCRGPITNCTIAGNSAGRDGGGFFGCNGPITNCIIWNNAAIDGPQLYRSTEPTYSCIQDWTSGGQGNIDADPRFIELGYWTDANDPNIIVEPNDPNAVWIDGDYHLLPYSLCIDAGDPNYIPEPNETDLDGNPRVNSGRIDMGAYETIMHEARLLILPRVINRKSRQPRIMAWMRLPQGITKDQIDRDVPLILYPGGIEAVRQFVFQNRRRGNKRTSIFAFFNKAELMDAIDTNGPVQLQVFGHLLKPGQYFYGSDTIRIIARRLPRRPHHRRR